MTGVTTSLFLEAGPGQDRLGFFDAAGRVQEIWFDPHHARNLIGSVHQVRIARLFPTQNRASASLADGSEISIRLRKPDLKAIAQGRVMPVTIVAAPRHGKPWQAVIGGRLVGRDFILLVGLGEGAPRFQLSSKIAAAERSSLLERLEAEIGPLLPHGFGVIARRQAGRLNDFASMVAPLLDAWRRGVREGGAAVGPLHDGGGLVARARRLFPDAALLDDPAHAIGFGHRLDEAVDAVGAARVGLPCGGTLWCEQTHALWSIDVDGAQVDDLTRLAREAVDETARQVRLRGMAGPIVLDLPRLPPKQARRALDQLAACLTADPRQVELLGRTPSGLIEMRVPHGEMPLAAIMQDQPAQDALAGLRLVAARPAFQPVSLAVSQAMADWLAGPGRAALESLDRPVSLVVWSDDAARGAAYIYTETGSARRNA